MLLVDPISDPNRISESDIRVSSETDSHERTNERTDLETNYATITPKVLNGTRAYRGLAAVGRFERLADAAAEAGKT